jgi:hypothetical protein
MEMKENDFDYRLERWIAAILSLLFLLPFVVKGQELAPPGQPKPDSPLHTTTLGEVSNAALLLKTAKPGVYLVAPTVKSEVAITRRFSSPEA